jgi:hypothetical protein
VSPTARLGRAGAQASSLAANLRERHELLEQDVEEMYALYETYYGGTSFALFREDLAEKSYVIELRAQGRMRGFSTLALMPFDFGGSHNLAIFSGDTIIDREFWGEQALVGAFCRFAGQLRARHPSQPLYWFLISKGYRTYRYLSAFAGSYYPHHAKPTPREVQELMDSLARRKFGEAYDPAAGVIRFPQSRGHLLPQWAEIREKLHVHPAVRFFLNRNPGFHAGEELVCLTELRAENLRSFAKRAFLDGLLGSRDCAVAP